MTSHDDTGESTELAHELPAESVGRLRELLGTKLVAYIAGAATRSVTSWVGESPPPLSSDEQSRLTAAVQVADYLSQHEDAVIIQSWFMGMNTALDDEAPARVLRESKDLDHDAARLLDAALSFVQA